MKQLIYITLFIASLVLAGCDRPSSLNDPVLAKVGDTTISQSHLDAMMGRLSAKAREQKNEKLNNTILQGLVRTRVLAIVAEQQMNDEERKSLNAKVQAYRDEFLAQTYIKKNIKPQPVTPDMVTKYYNAHISDYTKRGKITFDMLSTTAETVDDAILGEVVAALTGAKNISDWKQYAQTLNKKNYPIEYKSAQMHSYSMKEEMRSQAIKLNTGESGDIVYGEHMYIFKIVDKQPDVVQPLHEVSVAIRKILAPQQLKKELSKSIDQALQNVNVEYVN